VVWQYFSGLVARKRGRATIRVPAVRIADDLVERRFRPDAPGVLWVPTSPPRTSEGWVYLAAVQDAYSRRIVGWLMADHIAAELVVDALQTALQGRVPRGCGRMFARPVSCRRADDSVRRRI
jgi:putative transposase